MKSLERLISCMVTELSDHASVENVSDNRTAIREAAVYAQNLHNAGEVGPIVLDRFLRHIGYKS